MIHRKVSELADVASTEQIRPSDWNDFHLLEAFSESVRPAAGNRGRLILQGDGTGGIYLDEDSSWRRLGTGLVDTSSWTGTPQVTSGTWSVSSRLVLSETDGQHAAWAAGTTQYQPVSGRTPWRWGRVTAGSDQAPTTGNTILYLAMSNHDVGAGAAHSDDATFPRFRTWFESRFGDTFEWNLEWANVGGAFTRPLMMYWNYAATGPLNAPAGTATWFWGGKVMGANAGAFVDRFEFRQRWMGIGPGASTLGTNNWILKVGGTDSANGGYPSQPWDYSFEQTGVTGRGVWLDPNMRLNDITSFSGPFYMQHQTGGFTSFNDVARTLDKLVMVRIEQPTQGTGVTITESIGLEIVDEARSPDPGQWWAAKFLGRVVFNRVNKTNWTVGHGSITFDDVNAVGATQVRLTRIGSDDTTKVDSFWYDNMTLMGQSIAPVFQASTISAGTANIGQDIKVRTIDSATTGGTVTDQIGLRIRAGTKDGTVGVTNAYGVYIEAPTVGTTLNWGARILGGAHISGTMRYGTWSSNADAAVNGYVTITDDGGTTRKLATIA